MSNTTLYSIKEAAEPLGVNPRTLKNWERAGKVPPAKRNYRNWRVYTEEDIERIRKLMRIDQILTPEQDQELGPR